MEQMSRAISGGDTVSVSAAEEDAAMTLLNARNLYVRGEGDANSDGVGVSSRSRRAPKPAKHKNDLGALNPPTGHRRRAPQNANRKVKDVQWMERHLENVIVGKSAVEPPEMDTLLKFEDSCQAIENQAPLRQGYFQVVDMGQLSQSQLLMMADSTKDPACMPPELSYRAGVKQSKVACFSGQEAFYKGTTSTPKPLQKRQPRLGVTPLDISDDEKKIDLARKIQEVWKVDNNKVWKLVGKQDAPVVNRIQINYLRLFLLVKEFGGYEHALRTKEWSNIARKFGMEESNIGKNGHSLRMLYAQFIKPLRDFLGQE
jgi:hypothetical protein